MLKKVLKSTLLFSALIAGSLTANADNLAVADQVVAVVGNSAILLSEVKEASLEILDQRRSQGYTSDRNPEHEALELLLMQKLLYNQAQVDSIPVNMQAVEMAVTQMIDQEIAEHGSTKALEEYYKKPIFYIKDEMRTRFNEMQSAQAMQQDVESKVTITPGEVERYYRKLDKKDLPVIPDQYVFAQITKFPPSTADAKFRARESLLEMRERIMSGTRFDVLARMYSADGSAVRGGELDPSTKDSFEKPFGDALSKLSVGQVSGVVETIYGYHLIELLEKLPNEAYRCRHILIRPTFTNEEIGEATTALDSIRTQILTDSTFTFSDAAAKFSDDKYSKSNGGVVTNFEMLEMYNAMNAKLATTRFLREELGRDNYTQIMMLKEGDISRPFQSEDMRGNVMVKIIKLLEIVPSHPANLNNDYIRVEELALKDKKDRVFKDFVKDKVDAMYIRIDDRFKDAEFINKFWFK